jgi:hypothetical protein
MYRKRRKEWINRYRRTEKNYKKEEREKENRKRNRERKEKSHWEKYRKRRGERKRRGDNVCENMRVRYIKGEKEWRKQER